MRMRKHARVLSLVLITLLFLTPIVGHAQTSISLHIVSVDTKEEADHMTLSVYFTLVDDATGKPISESPAKTAKITDIDSNNSVTANIDKAQNPLFIGLLTGVILIMGGLQFFPALALGPIVEHFQVLAAVAGH